MAQLMPLPLTVSCFSKIQIGFTFLILVHLGSPGKRAVKRVCVCVVSIDGCAFVSADLSGPGEQRVVSSNVLTVWIVQRAVKRVCECASERVCVCV